MVITAFQVFLSLLFVQALRVGGVHLITAKRGGQTHPPPSSLQNTFTYQVGADPPAPLVTPLVVIFLSLSLPAGEKCNNLFSGVNGPESFM